jgi:transcriptional regulator with XRE-family HTH domain
MDIYERLDYLMKAKNLTVYRLSKELGFAKPGAFYAIRSRKVKPSYDTLTALLSRYDDLNGDWLLRGVGEAFKAAPASPSGSGATLADEGILSVHSLQERVAALEQQVRDRDEIIALLKQQVLLMKELLHRHAAEPAQPV